MSVADAFDEGFVPISGADPLMIPLRTWQREALRIYTANGIGTAIIDMGADFIIGAGIRIEADDPNVKDILDMHWLDEVNDWESGQHVRAVGLSMFGECALRIMIPEKGSGATNALARVSEISPADILEYRCDPQFPNVVSFIQVRAGTKKDKKEWLQVVRRGPLGEIDLDFGAAKVDGNQPVEGLCVYAGVNRFVGHALGRPDILSIIDWLDILDKTVHQCSERAALMSAHVYDVTVKTKDDKKVKQAQKDFRARPKPGTVWVHGDGITAKEMSPKLGSEDMKGLSSMIEAFILAGGRTSKPWLGRGDDVNRASASEMSPPLMKHFAARQRAFVCGIVEKVLSIQVQVALNAGMITADQAASNWRAAGDDLAQPTPEESAKIIESLTASLGLAVEQDFLEQEEAKIIYRETLEGLGIKVPTEVTAESGSESEEPESAPDLSESSQPFTQADRRAYVKALGGIVRMSVRRKGFIAAQRMPRRRIIVKSAAK